MKTTEPIIVTEQLTKSYGKQRGIVELSFAVERGEVFGYLGPNGAGKTTTIRTLLDFIRPTSGRATIFGMDARDASVAIHARTGFLPGEYRTYERMTGREYLTYFARLRDGAGRDRIDELAERLDLEIGIQIRSLSHGNKQKLGLVQAFMHRPELLVLDEPTQGLDPLVQQEFQRLVFEAREAGATMFLSSHVLSEAEHLCDRVAIIREGRLVTVEDVGDMKAKMTRSLEMHFETPPPLPAFTGLPGVSDAELHGDVVRCTVVGEMDAVIKAAARFHLVDLQSHERSLEEIFLEFYGPNGGPRSEAGARVGGGDPS